MSHYLLKEHTKEFTIAVVTALPKEKAAFSVMMSDRQSMYPIDAGALQYEVGTVPSLSDRPLRVVLVQALRMGNNAAAVTATHLLRDYPSVRDIVMVGIAGGIPKKFTADDTRRGRVVQIHLGDIVVSKDKGVVQWDMVKLEDDKLIMRGVAPPPSSRLVAVVDALEAGRIEGKRPWEIYLAEGKRIENGTRPHEMTDPQYSRNDGGAPLPPDQTRRAGLPTLHYGAIGSANTLLKNVKKRDTLRSELDVIAVEMEGSGIADATWAHGAGYLLVRGICDYCDGEKDDVWQGYAAIVAAAYARAVIERLPPPG